MSVYKICPDCGAHLDPGEQCDCGAPGGSEQAAKQDTQQAGHPAP